MTGPVRKESVRGTSEQRGRRAKVRRWQPSAVRACRGDLRIDHVRTRRVADEGSATLALSVLSGGSPHHGHCAPTSSITGRCGMRTLIADFQKDEAGFIVSAELVILATLLVVGLIAGMSGVQHSIVGEYTEVAGALRSLDQSYGTNGMHGCWSPNCGFSSWTAGSGYPLRESATPVCFDCCRPETASCVTCVPDAVISSVPVPVPEVGIPCPPDAVAPPVNPPCAAPDCPPAPHFEVSPNCDSAAVITPIVRPCPCALRDCNPNTTRFSDTVYTDIRPLHGPLVW